MVYKNLLISEEAGILAVTFNRPEVLNAISEEMLDELRDVLNRARNEAEIRVVILTGSGRAFSVGSDVRGLLRKGPAEMERYNRQWIDFLKEIESLRKPVVASLNGYANIEVFQACDLVLSSDEAKIGLPEINIGVIPGAGASARLPRIVGPFRAKELILTGRWMDAKEAERFGLVNKVVPKEKLADETKKLAVEISHKAPLALAAAKSAINIGGSMDVDKGTEYALREFLALFATEDQKEGMAAFLENRKPKYKGR